MSLYFVNIVLYVISARNGKKGAVRPFNKAYGMPRVFYPTVTEIYPY